MAYMLDADVFISAKNFHYGFDFCPAFWDWLVRANELERVFSIERVGGELKAGDDRLSEWAAQRGDGFFLKPTPEMLPALAAVSNWVVTHGYEPAAVDAFLQVADYYLVAHALAHGHSVVSHQIRSTSKRRVKLPDVCKGLDVECRTPFELLNKKRALFILGNRP